MNDTPFLSRWSRLKNEAKAPVVVESPTAVVEVNEEALNEKLQTLPSLDILKAGDDLSVFMQAWVPDSIKNAAMRKMWTLDASLTEQLCAPLDYAYDYNNPTSIDGWGLLPADYDPIKEVEKLFKGLIKEEEKGLKSEEITPIIEDSVDEA